MTIDHSSSMNVYPPEFYEQVVQSMPKIDPVAESTTKQTQSNVLDLSLRQLEYLSILVRGNEYEQYLMSHINSVKVELQRQYNVINNINAYV
tara:strand:+ start:430 stop:705 length:276 start_codon:yes stop_codon:yes gene_type:complete